MADYAARMIAGGVRMVGGCCGTTPEHVRAMRHALDRLAPGRAAARVTSPRRARAEEAEAPALPTTAAPTALERKIASGEFLVTVELDPPRGHNIEKLVQGAKLLKERGVEIVDINDGSLGRVRMSVLPTAILIRDGTGPRRQHALHLSRPEPDGHPGRRPRRPRAWTSGTSWP